jgi:cell division protein FtsI (penicillin-binding protein 3)
MTRIKHSLRLTFVTLFIIGFSVAIVISILKIINAKEYSEIAHLKTAIIPAERGNIYTYNYKLLAVTSLRYELRYDGTYLDASQNDLEELAFDLARIFQNKSKKEYLIDLNNAENKKYFLLKRDASLDEVEKIKEINFYQKPLKGGLLIEQYSSRKKPNSNSAARTIGDLRNDNTPKYGLEYSYNSELMGKDGKSIVLREPGVNRIIDNSNNIDPESGKDLITTLELDYQDILEKSLLRQLEKHDADFGTAILMSVKTGQIKAITNLKKTEKGTYADIENFAVTRQIEPGSTFKMASIMSYLEDYNGNIHDTIDCKNGTYKFKGAKIATIDHEKLGRVSLKEAFAHSSNIGIARLITKYYKKNPELFVNRLYNFGLGDKSKIDLIGAPKPDIKFPSDESWSGVSLPWMSYGYELRLTPLDILTFYNTVANNGYSVNPHLGHLLRTGSNLIEISRDEMTHTICSESTIKKIQLLLREVVLTGTGKELNNLPFSVSGKTGTSVKNYGNKNKHKEYQASFVGFFPSESPQYSCIVLIDNPNPKIGFYGSQVALPAFKEIAHNIYIKDGLQWDGTHVERRNLVNNSLKDLLDNYDNKFPAVNNHEHYPSVVGMHVRDAICVLENAGYEVIVKGSIGTVKNQYPKANSKVKRDLAITLFI